jgi:serine/threonine protein kinase
MKNDSELQIEFNTSLSMKQVIRQASRKYGGNDNKICKLYNKKGVVLFEEDFGLIAANDVLYFAPNGENFNYCAILDDYDLGRVLGVGGFGKVLLGKHKVTKNQVAIKFTDVGNELSSANLISSIYKEAESLKALIHKHIIQLFHAFIEGKQFIMIMEAAMGGELLDYLKKHQ